MNKKNVLILTILGGWFGLHKFINKQIGKGILYFCTYGLFCLGWFYDIYVAYNEFVIEKEQINDKDNKVSSKIKIKLENVKNYDCHQYIGLLTYNGIIDKAKLYNGYLDKDIKYTSIKYYEYNGGGLLGLPCSIIYDDKINQYKVIYEDEQKTVEIGLIPQAYNQKVNDIINECNNFEGGLFFDKGYYKMYDEKQNKIITKYDDYIITLDIYYK